MKRIDSCISFLTGFLLHVNLLVGGSSEGAAAAGGYGFRITDFMAVVCAVLLLPRLYNPSRIFAFYVYSVVLVALFVFPAVSDDPRTAILALHYILCGFAGLYLSLAIADDPTPFCFGLVFGLAGSIGIFVLQNSGVPESQLVAWGLAPGFRPYLFEIARELPRYSGLWSHPNEVGHVAALGAPGAAYLYLVQRRFWPLVLTAICLLATFYFCWSRGGFTAGALTLIIAMLWPRDGKIGATHIVAILAMVAAAFGLTQIDFISSRFAADPNVQGNITERLELDLQGLYLAIQHPLGLSINDYFSEITSATGGVGSPHNGFLFFGAVLGVLPLCVLVWALIANLNPREERDVIFSVLAIQFCISAC